MTALSQPSSVLALPPALVPCSVDDPLHAGRVKKAEVLGTERRMLVLLLVMTSWKVILGFEQEEMVDKVDVDLVEFDHGLDPGIPGLPGSCQKGFWEVFVLAVGGRGCHQGCSSHHSLNF